MTGSTGNHLDFNTSIDLYFYDEEEQQENILAQLQKQQKKNYPPQSELKQQECSISEKSEKSNSSSPKAQKSLYHNFQKHSIATLKYMIAIGYLKKDEESNILARKIWNAFLESKMKSKEVFTILFGNPQKDQKQIKAVFEKYGFGEICKSQYHLICNAQNILRQLAINQVTQQSLDKHLKIRKITRKQSFRLYMLGLIDELKGGAILKRITKSKSQEINNVMQGEWR